MQDTKTIRVLIAHDNIMTLEGLATIIGRRQDMEVVAKTHEVPGLLEIVLRSCPDVLLMDLRLNGLESFDVIRTVRDRFPKIGILIFSNYEGSEDIYRALRAGVKGYLLKSASDSELAEAIKTIHAGRKHIPNEIAIRLAERIDHSTLTQREHEVLLQIVKGKSNKEIADALEIVEATVKFHVNSILTKLGVTDRTQAATAALLRGIIHSQDLS